MHIRVAGSVHVTVAPAALRIIKSIQTLFVDGRGSEVELAIVEVGCS